MCIKYRSVYVRVHIYIRGEKANFLIIFSMIIFHAEVASCPSMSIFLLFIVLF